MPTSHKGVALLGVVVVVGGVAVAVVVVGVGRARNFGRVHDRMTERRWNVVEPQSLQVYERKRSSKRSNSVIFLKNVRTIEICSRVLNRKS